MILIFDTETTGVVNERAPSNHPSQPHLVQLAAQLCEDSGDAIAGVSFIVNPDVPIPEKAASVHGITDARASKLGVSPELAVRAFGHLCACADIVVAHNIKFDIVVMEAAGARVYLHLKTMQAAA